MSVNGNDVDGLTHDEVWLSYRHLLSNFTFSIFINYVIFFFLFFFVVTFYKVVKLIRSTKDSEPEGKLVLTIRPLGIFAFYLLIFLSFFIILIFAYYFVCFFF